MQLSLHPSPPWGPLMSPRPSSVMPDRSDGVWNEMRGLAQIWEGSWWRRGPLPSRDESNYWQYYLQLWTLLDFHRQTLPLFWDLLPLCLIHVPIYGTVRFMFIQQSENCGNTCGISSSGLGIPNIPARPWILEIEFWPQRRMKRNENAGLRGPGVAGFHLLGVWARLSFWLHLQGCVRQPTQSICW